MKHLGLSLQLFSALVFCASLSAQDRGGGFRGAFGDRFMPSETAATKALNPQGGLDALHRWNHVAMDATALDHTPVKPGEDRTFGEQFGPGRASRATAIVNIAMADVVSAVTGEFESYTGVKAEHNAALMEVAMAQAAHDTLAALYPSQKAIFDTRLAEDLARAVKPQTTARAISLGQKVAAKILEMRNDDGSAIPEPRVNIDWPTSNEPGHWRQDPISQTPLALGAHWGEVRPFVLESGSQFRPPPPPALNSREYTAGYNETKRLGGDGVTTPTERTAEQSFIGVFWAYDATPNLCAPPRLYNELTLELAAQTGLSMVQTARLLALVNTTMADAAITAWWAKYHYDLWRPITGIRESDPGTGPTGLGDGNQQTEGDPSFTPMGAPADNLHGPNFTPPFPSYPSGHATIGGAIFEVFRRFYGKDNVSFTVVSDEFDGTTYNNQGVLRPYRPRHFDSFSQAAEENAASRVYLGIHWPFDGSAGIAAGSRVGDYVFDRAFVPSGGAGSIRE
jgi:membrane-associated phospholipid phosphatase